MPRVARKAPGGIVYHCLNRGNNRQPIFHKRGDARAFLELLAEAKRRVPMRVPGFCLMNNHWHLLVRRIPGPAPVSIRDHSCDSWT